MIKIKPIFITTITTDVLNADGSIWMPKGSQLSFASSFKTKKFGEFTLLAPNPVHLLLTNTNEIVNRLVSEENIINECKKITVFSKLVNGVNEYSTDELLKLDPSATQIRNLDQDKLYRYLYLGVSCLITLIASVEAFTNQELPHDYKLTITDKNGITKVLDKKDIETGRRLEEKMELLGQILCKPDFKQQTFWQDFKNIKRIRDEFIHIKTRGSQKVDRNDELFDSIFEFDFIKGKLTIVELINYFINGYIEES